MPVTTSIMVPLRGSITMPKGTDMEPVTIHSP